MYRQFKKLLKKQGLLTAIGIVLICAIGIIAFIGATRQKFRNKIYNNVYIDNIHVGNQTKTEAQKTLNKLYKTKQAFAIEFIIEDSPVSTVSAEEINYLIPIQSAVEQAFLIGRSNHTLSALYQHIATTIGWERYHFTLTPSFDTAYLRKQLNELNDAYKVDPIDARFEFNNNRAVAFQLDKKGFALNVDVALDELEQKLYELKKRPQSTVIVHLKKQILQPQVQLKDINQFGIIELIAEGRSQFVGSSPERVHNIQTGSNKLNGIIIKPNETFSFVENLGDVSQATGFKQAFIISGGKTVLGDGGGICQVSTTLFRAILNAGLPVIERRAHAYRVGYYEQDAKPGLDATVYSPSVDLKFTNNYEQAILIQTEVDAINTTLSFKLYGTKDERNVEISEPVVWNQSPPPPAQYVDDYSLPTGVVKQVDFAAWGASSKFNYKVTKNNHVIEQQEFISHFRPWKAIFLVGKGPV